MHLSDRLADVHTAVAQLNTRHTHTHTPMRVQHAAASTHSQLTQTLPSGLYPVSLTKDKPDSVCSSCHRQCAAMQHTCSVLTTSPTGWLHAKPHTLFYKHAEPALLPTYKTPTLDVALFTLYKPPLAASSAKGLQLLHHSSSITKHISIHNRRRQLLLWLHVWRQLRLLGLSAMVLLL